jgi:hypothetical protein
MRALLVIVISIAAALAGCNEREMDEGATDADRDGLPKLEETTPHNITVTNATGVESTRAVTSDPDSEDGDGDGLDDVTEYRASSDPLDADTDADGLLDGHDVKLDAGDARVAKWRARPVAESPALTFLGELDRCAEIGGLKATQASSDRPLPDELPDGSEIRGWDITLRGHAVHVAADPCSPDGDRDSVTDDVELARGTNPGDADTDGDGTRDSQDADPLWNVSLAFSEIASSVSGAKITLTLGSTQRTIDAPGSADLDVTEQGSYHELEVPLLASATDASGQPLRLFPTGSGAVLAFDVFEQTVRVDDDAAATKGTLRLEGADGSVTIAWAVVRA